MSGGSEMKVDYDREGDTIQIALGPVNRLERDEAGIAGVIVGFCGKRPVMVDVIGTPIGVDRRLRVVGEHYGLDPEALSAAAHAALAAPDRAIGLDVTDRLDG